MNILSLLKSSSKFHSNSGAHILALTLQVYSNIGIIAHKQTLDQMPHIGRCFINLKFTWFLIATDTKSPHIWCETQDSADNRKSPGRTQFIVIVQILCGRKSRCETKKKKEFNVAVITFKYNSIFS